LLYGALAAVTTPCVTVRAQPARQAKKVYTVGVLTSLAAPSPVYAPVLIETLREHGHEVGRNVRLESRYAAGRAELLPDLAADLVRQRVDVILALGPAESQAAVRATRAIPIVFTSTAPVELGLVPRLSRPGGNATGVAVDVTPEVAGKLLELLKTMSPGVSRVVTLVDADRPDLAIYERAATEAARRLHLQGAAIALRHEAELDAAFASIARERPDALVLAAGPLVLLHRRRIVDFAVRHAVPTVAYLRDFVDDGGLMSYGPSFGELMRRVAVYLGKILDGASPGDLPVEQPSRFELVINRTTARALGLAIPPSLLLRADHIVE
jgi:putative ABC transport system substrate-binding protein